MAREASSPAITSYSDQGGDVDDGSFKLGKRGRELMRN
jgi:hypothetical protein